MPYPFYDLRIVLSPGRSPKTSFTTSVVVAKKLAEYDDLELALFFGWFSWGYLGVISKQSTKGYQSDFQTDNSKHGHMKECLCKLKFIHDNCYDDTLPSTSSFVFNFSERLISTLRGIQFREDLPLGYRKQPMFPEFSEHPLSINADTVASKSREIRYCIFEEAKHLARLHLRN